MYYVILDSFYFLMSSEFDKRLWINMTGLQDVLLYKYWMICALDFVAFDDSFLKLKPFNILTDVDNLQLLYYGVEYCWTSKCNSLMDVHVFSIADIGVEWDVYEASSYVI